MYVLFLRTIFCKNLKQKEHNIGAEKQYMYLFLFYFLMLQRWHAGIEISPPFLLDCHNLNHKHFSRI